MTDTRTETDAALEAGLVLGAPEPLDMATRLYSITIPDGASRETLDLEQYRGGPYRDKGIRRVFDARSFGALFQRYRAGASTVYADPTTTSLVAVINESASLEPGWRDHRLELVFTPTPAWSRWVNLDGKLMSQSTFAEHVEDSAADIVEPDAATMLEVAQSFQATNKVAFRAAVRLSSGQRQFTYAETIEATAGQSGDLLVPETIVLGIAPFEGGPRYSITARLRYRLNEGALTLGYKLDRPDDVKRNAFDEQVAAVETETGSPAILGRP